MAQPTRGGKGGAGSGGGSRAKTVKAGVGLSIETPRKHQAAAGANGKTPRKHQAVAGSNGATAQKHRAEEKKVGGGSSEQKMASKSYRTERASPSRQLCHPPLSTTRRPGTNTERPAAREKQQSKSNPSFPRETNLRVDRKLRRTSSKDACAGLSSVGNTAAHRSEELTADEKRRLTEEMMIKVTQQGRKDDPHDAELEDNYRLRCVKEKLKCFVEDETKLDGDHILDNLDKEGLLWYIEKDDMFDWSFQYLTAAALDDYQRLVPQNRGGCEYVHWDDYRMYFHKYEIELEYLDFWEELSKKLKWMEDYIHIGWPTLKWGRICRRGESQAIKIATGFSI